MRNTFVILLLMAVPVFAHDTVAGHTCEKPDISMQLSSTIEREILHAQLAIFESCMFDYIRDQQRQASVHEQAAQAALEEWNALLQAE
jgi:hypothetical protein